MKKNVVINMFIATAASLAILIASGCGGGSGSANPPLPPGTNKVTPAELQAALKKGFFTTGSAPSRFEARGAEIYTLNSLSNTMTVNSAYDGAAVRTISFPVGAGPFDLEWVGDACYICANGTNAVYRYRAGQDAVDGESVSLALGGLEALAYIGPGEMAAYGGKLYVPISGIVSFGDPSSGIEAEYAPGRIAVLDLAAFAFERFINVPFVNPTAAYTSPDGIIYFVCTGESQFTAEYEAYAGSEGGIVAFNPASGQVVYSLSLGETLPGTIILVNQDVAYVGSNLKAEVYRVRLDTGIVQRGPDNPIVLTQEFSFVSGFAGLPGLGVLAGSFNTDEVFFIDPNDDGVGKSPFTQPFDFGESDTFFGGVQDVLYFRENEKHKIFVLQGIANKVGAVDLTQLWNRIRLE
ncbi:MAG: hypothetical protein HRF49_02045 [bacterium]|jgi:hypothetical protein